MGYTPNKAIHPGTILAEMLEREGMSQKSLSERTGISEKHLSQIINGEASITVETSLSLENVLGGSAAFWINLEKNYQETKARVERAAQVREEVALLRRFPYAEIARRGYVERTADRHRQVENLWKFFGVNSLSYVAVTESVAFRMKSSGASKSESIAAWLRCGELEAKRLELPPYSESALKGCLARLKILSLIRPSESPVTAAAMLRKAGVALILVDHFPGTRVSGAVRWINDRPVIQLSFLHPWADVFWFNLYHEIGHLLMHGKKGKFIEYDRREHTQERSKEHEADTFAADLLLHPRAYAEFVASRDFSQKAICMFAERMEVHPGIVAGRLCHDRHMEWTSLSSLRMRISPSFA